ncbi:MAG: hypothetical protein HQK81_10970 [Desulfovibrionaceae bacterium]|nr:hypothetical protein [Desulfovibrionaceae bacterium]MBF0514563.1 hypothetical protein [Desulfovibrionaceae bacterium]
MNFLKPDKSGVLKVLGRIALHHPRSKQIGVLDILAEDYAVACRDMTMGQFESAAMKANADSNYFPVIKQIREAHAALKESEALCMAGQTSPEPMEDWDAQKHEISAQRARDVLEALRTGIKPAWMKQ